MTVTTAGLKTMNFLLAAVAFGVQAIVGLTTYFVTKPCKDPFDPDFQIIFSPQFQVIPPVTQDTCQISGLANAINGAQNHAGRAVSYQGAINVTAGREQSAFTFANDSSASSQDTALGGYENMIVAELRAAQAGFQGVAAMIAGTACDETITQNDFAVFLADVQARGVAALPVQEVNLILQFGVDPQVIVDDLTSVSYDPSQLPLSVSAMLNRIAVILGQIADAF